MPPSSMEKLEKALDACFILHQTTSIGRKLDLHQDPLGIAKSITLRLPHPKSSVSSKSSSTVISMGLNFDVPAGSSIEG